MGISFGSQVGQGGLFLNVTCPPVQLIFVESFSPWKATHFGAQHGYLAYKIKVRPK